MDGQAVAGLHGIVWPGNGGPGYGQAVEGLRGVVPWCVGKQWGLHCVVWTGSCHWGPVYGQAGWGLALCGTMALGRAMVGLHWVVWTGSCGPVWASSGGLALCGTCEPGYRQAGQGLALRGIML